MTLPNQRSGYQAHEMQCQLQQAQGTFPVENHSKFSPLMLGNASEAILILIVMVSW